MNSLNLGFSVGIYAYLDVIPPITDFTRLCLGLAESVEAFNADVLRASKDRIVSYGLPEETSVSIVVISLGDFFTPESSVRKKLCDFSPSVFTIGSSEFCPTLFFKASTSF